MEFYTDGSCRLNGKERNVGAYGFILVIDKVIIGKQICKLLSTSNQRCEMLGILTACNYANYHYDLEKEPVTIYTDSAYCYNCYHDKWYEKWQQNGWKTSKNTPVINKEIWEQLIPYFNNPNIKIEKVKAHADNYYNNIIDALVQDASR